MSDMTNHLTHEYEVFRSRNPSGYNVAYLFTLQQLLEQYQRTFPEACKYLEEDKVQARYPQYVRTSHLAKRAFAEKRRRTKAIPHSTRRNSITGNAVRAKLERELPSEGDDAACRGRIGTAATLAETAASNG